MNDIHILDQSFNLLGIIDEYASVIWRPSYSDVGDFEIYLGTTENAIELLKENNYVVRSSDITVDSSGNVTYKKVMIVKNINIVTDVEDGDYMTVTGREIKYLLHQRIVWEQTVLNGTAEEGIRQLIEENAIFPSDTNRVIPKLVLGSAKGMSDTIEKQLSGEHVDEAITAICTTYNYGWDIYIYNDSLTVEIYQGLDRSYAQTDRPYVVFSEDFENLHNTEYQLSTEEFANTALIGGEGEGTDRKYTTVGGNNSGLLRYEIFVEADNISSNSGSEDEITEKEYLSLLQEKGKEKLSELSYTEAFTGEVLNNTAFIYGKDYYLGDLVTVINKYGRTKDVRVLSAIESDDDTGTKLIPQFNI